VERFAATEEMALVLHDTTEFSYHREDGRAIGLLSNSTRPTNLIKIKLNQWLSDHSR
jgi:hypothetical protein